MILHKYKYNDMNDMIWDNDNIVFYQILKIYNNINNNDNYIINIKILDV